MKNTYITYSKLLSLVHYYFLMTGGEDFMLKGELPILINMSIQDIINNSSFSFMSEFQKVEKGSELYEGMYNIYETKYPINKVHELLIEGDGGNIGDIVNRMPYFNSKEFFFKRGTNILYGPKDDCDFITINYEREFEYNDLSSDKDLKKELPIPFTYVPALMKMIFDWASPFTFFQGEGTTTDFYGHGKTRLNDLVDSDILSSKLNVNVGEL